MSDTHARPRRRRVPEPAVLAVPGRTSPLRRGTLALLLLVAAVAGSAIPAPEARADTERSIRVEGTAEERVAPDMAILRMAVVVDAQDARAARADADTAVAAALEVLRAHAIGNQDIDTSGLRISPQYRWVDETRERQLTGYRVTRNIEVRLLDLDALGDLMTGLTDAGVNQIEAPTLGLAEPEVVYRRVLAAAAENARARAEVLAATLGEELGAVIAASTEPSAPPLPLRREALAMAADAGNAGAATYQSADLSFRVNISVTFGLE